MLQWKTTARNKISKYNDLITTRKVIFSNPPRMKPKVDKSAQSTYITVLLSVYTTTCCRWQTRTTRCMKAKVLQTSSVQGKCDQLATELNWQRFASKVEYALAYSTCIERPVNGGRFEFCRDFRRQKTRVPGLVTNKQTETGRQLMPALTSVTQVKKSL